MFRKSKGSDAGEAGRAAAVPALSIAMVAVLVLAGLGAAGSGKANGGSLLSPASVLDYATSPLLSIPRLSAEFIGNLFNRDPDPKRTVATPPRPVVGPTTVPTPTPTATNNSTALIPIAKSVKTSMRVDRTHAVAGGFVTYSIVARNEGTASYTGTFNIETHTPLGTARCDAALLATQCTVPGDYNGGSTAETDRHVNPQQQLVIRTIAGGRESVLYSVRVQVLQGTPPGTRLHNHAHVSVTGAGERYVFRPAPEVVVE